MKYITCIVFYLSIFTNAQSQFDREKLLDKGVPVEFVTLFDEYVAIADEYDSGAREDEKARHEIEIQEKFEEIVSKFPKKTGDYLADIISLPRRTQQTLVAFALYDQANIRSQKMIDLAHQYLAEVDWENTTNTGGKRYFKILLDTGDKKEIEFIKSLMLRMDDIEKGFYRSSLNRRIAEYEKRMGNHEVSKTDRPVLPNPTPLSRINTDVEKTKVLDEESEAEVFDVYLWGGIGLLTFLGVGVFFLRKSA